MRIIKIKYIVVINKTEKFVCTNRFTCFTFKNNTCTPCLHQWEIREIRNHHYYTWRIGVGIHHLHPKAILQCIFSRSIYPCHISLDRYARWAFIIVSITTSVFVIKFTFCTFVIFICFRYMICYISSFWNLQEVKQIVSLSLFSCSVGISLSKGTAIRVSTLRDTETEERG